MTIGVIAPQQRLDPIDAAVQIGLDLGVPEPQDRPARAREGTVDSIVPSPVCTC